MSTTVHVPKSALHQSQPSPDQWVQAGQRFDECREGEEFTLTEVTIGPTTRYRVKGGKAVVVEVEHA